MLSIVVPAYNEEESFPRLELRLRPVLDSLGEEYELLVIDDGSTDSTNFVLQECAARWPQLRVISLTRNVGQQLAIAAGLERARGTWVVTMDADLQDPPELLPEMMLTARRKHLDVVYAQRIDRSSDTFLKRFTARLYYRFMRRASGVDLLGDVGDFRLMSRRVVDVLNRMPERHKVYRLLVPWLSFPSGVVEYRREERAGGSSGYSVRRMIRLAAWSLTSFSTAPLRVATWLGLGAAFMALALAGVAVGAWAYGRTIPGWTSTTIAVLFLGAVQLLCVGLLGEYVGRIYEQVQARPFFVLQDDSGSVLDLSEGGGREQGRIVGVLPEAGVSEEGDSRQPPDGEDAFASYGGAQGGVHWRADGTEIGAGAPTAMESRQGTKQHIPAPEPHDVESGSRQERFERRPGVATDMTDGDVVSAP